MGVERRSLLGIGAVVRGSQGRQDSGCARDWARRGKGGPQHLAVN